MIIIRFVEVLFCIHLSWLMYGFCILCQWIVEDGYDIWDPLVAASSEHVCALLTSERETVEDRMFPERDLGL